MTPKQIFGKLVGGRWYGLHEIIEETGCTWSEAEHAASTWHRACMAGEVTSKWDQNSMSRLYLFGTSLNKPMDRFK